MMQGLLSNPVISGLLSGGPNAIRARSQQQVAQMLPRAGGGMMGAPSPIVQSGGGMGAGLAGLGEGLQKFAQVRKEQAAQEQAKSSLEKVLGLQSGGEAIAENVSMGGQPGPTQAAAQRQDPNPMKLPAGIVQAARMAYDSGDYSSGLGLVRNALTATNDQEYVNATNPITGEIIPVRKGVQPPPGYVMSGDYKAPTADGTPAYKDAIILGLQPGTPAFNDYIRKRTLPSPPPSAPEKIKLWYGDKSVDVTPGSQTEKYYREAGYKSTPSESSGIKPQDVFDNEKDLRSEVTNVNKTFGQTANQFRRVEAAVKKPSPANDIALVFSYMKMLDPTSVVRENEQATAQNAGGVPQRIRAQWNALQSGENFTPEQRKDFYQSAVDVYSSQLTQYQKDLDYYRGVAQRNSLNPENIINDISFVPTSVDSIGGGVQSGYRNAAPPLSPKGGAAIPSAEPNPNFDPAEALGEMSGMKPDALRTYLESLSDADLDAISTYRAGSQ
jgi:hypothetical protein